MLCSCISQVGIRYASPQLRQPYSRLYFASIKGVQTLWQALHCMELYRARITSVLMQYDSSASASMKHYACWTDMLTNAEFEHHDQC